MYQKLITLDEVKNQKKILQFIKMLLSCDNEMLTCYVLLFFQIFNIDFSVSCLVDTAVFLGFTSSKDFFSLSNLVNRSLQVKKIFDSCKSEISLKINKTKISLDYLKSNQSTDETQGMKGTSDSTILWHSIPFPLALEWKDHLTCVQCPHTGCHKRKLHHLPISGT